MRTNSAVACSINVTRGNREQEALVTYIQPGHSGVNDTLSEFTCKYTSPNTSVECSRLGTAACNSSTSHTSFRLRDTCCHDKCVCLVWSDAKEQLIYDNTTLEIYDTNCSLSVMIESELVPPTTPFLNETSHGQELNITVKDMATSANHHDPTLVVALVVSGLFAVDIILVVVFILCRRRRGRSHMGDNKIVEEKREINTGSFRNLEAELPTEYVNTNQTRLYSGLEFVNGVSTDQHDYAKIETSVKSQNTDECNTQDIYEETELCKPTEVPQNHYINSSNSSHKLEDDGRTYSTTSDSYATLEDLKDGSLEVNRPITVCFTVETSYIDLNDESTDDTYVKADTENDNSHASDCSSSRANMYANTEASADEEVAEYTNVSPRKLTIKL